METLPVGLAEMKLPQLIQRIERTLFKPRILRPIPPKGMAYQRGIIVPTHLAEIERSEILRDAGVTSASSYSLMFGERLEVADAVSLLGEYSREDLVAFISRMALHMTHTGLHSAKSDRVQAEAFRIIDSAASHRGLVYTSDFLDHKKREKYLIHPLLLNALFAVAFSLPENSNSKVTVGADQRPFFLAASILNDWVFDPIDVPPENSHEYCLRIIRQNLAQVPLLGVMETFKERIHKLYSLFEGIWTAGEQQDLRKRIDETLVAAYGVDFDTLLRLLIPANVLWMTRKQANQNVVIGPETFQSKKARDDFSPFLQNTSKTLEELHQLFFAAAKVSPETFFRSADSTRVLIHSPFVKVTDQKFMLLNPTSLFRWFEIAISSAFIQSEQTDIRNLYGPLGVSFERFVNRTLENAFSSPDLFEPNPKIHAGEELCDAILDGKDVSIVFEHKYRPPSLGAIDVSTSDTSHIRRWVNSVFTKHPSQRDGTTPGAIWQLQRAASNVLAGGRQYTPARVLPIVIVSEELLFGAALYSILDAEIKEKSVFYKYQEVTCPVLVFSVSEIEMLSRIDFEKTKFTLRTLLVEKSTAHGARNMNTVNFVKRLNLPFKANPDTARTVDLLFEKAMTYFDEPSALKS